MLPPTGLPCKSIDSNAALGGASFACVCLLLRFACLDGSERCSRSLARLKKRLQSRCFRSSATTTTRPAHPIQYMVPSPAPLME